MFDLTLHLPSELKVLPSLYRNDLHSVFQEIVEFILLSLVRMIDFLTYNYYIFRI